MKNLIHDERGNVFIFILIGVALFAALAFTVARGFRSEGTSNLSKQKVSLIATDLASAGPQFESGVSALRNKGVSESDISFESQDTAANANCLTDTCKIFNPSGGRVSWKTLPGDLVLPGSVDQRWQFSGTNEIPGLGTNGGTAHNSDLIAFIEGLPADVCKQLNTKITGSSTIPVLNNVIDTATGEPFAGTYGTNAVTVLSGTVSGKTSLCVQNGSGGNYIFYYVILAR